MTTIGIADFEKLVMERLENPSLFENKTLVLWSQRCYRRNLPERIIRKCCIRFNKLFPENQAWYKLYSGYTFVTENYTEIKECCEVDEMYGWKYHGILLNDGGYSPSDLKDDWLRFVNTHNNSVGHLSSQWPMIAYANNLPELEAGNFGDNCTLCRFLPSIDEWHNWFKTACPADILDPIVSYMRVKGLSPDSHPWEILLDELVVETIEREVDLNKMTREEYEDALRGYWNHHLPKSLTDDLWDFIHKQDYGKR